MRGNQDTPRRRGERPDVLHTLILSFTRARCVFSEPGSEPDKVLLCEKAALFASIFLLALVPQHVWCNGAAPSLGSDPVQDRPLLQHAARNRRRLRAAALPLARSQLLPGNALSFLRTKVLRVGIGWATLKSNRAIHCVCESTESADFCS